MAGLFDAIAPRPLAERLRPQTLAEVVGQDHLIGPAVLNTLFMMIGIPIGMGVIVFTIVITGIYVRRANDEFDRLTKEIMQEVSK